MSILIAALTCAASGWIAASHVVGALFTGPLCWILGFVAGMFLVISLDEEA